MPTFIKTGYWESASKSYKGWLNLEDLIFNVIPSQAGNAGKYLKTNGSSLSWATVDALPLQTGNNGKYLTTNGSVASWASVVAPNIYTQDGALTADRTVTMGINKLYFDGGIFIKYNVQSRLISTYYGAGTDGNNIYIGGGGLNSISGGLVWYGSYNTAVGVNACLANTTGTFTVGVGYNSLAATTTGWANVSVGARSMQAGTTASFSVSIGKDALRSVLTSNDNVAIGCDALNLSTGAQNTAIGRSAGMGGGASNTTGSNNIFIGLSAVGESGTDSNRTWIGNSSTASTWLGGKLLIGTKTSGVSIVRIVGLPTSSAGLASGDLWNNAGVVNIIP